MLSILGSWILGTLVLAQAIVFTVACCLPIYVLTLVKVLSPRWEWRRSLTTRMTRLTEFWARGITGLFDTLLPTLWEIESA